MARQSSKATRPRKTLVLCFDGTGNKFQGTAGDSNIIKIFSCLDREDPNQQHYYQPGIGTYTSDRALHHTSTYARLRSWYHKSKDAAVGTGFENHVMGGYKFLMRYYQPGDDVYFFGFSRGAYTARFLAQMLDYVGLLAPGNEELLRFAWKTFARWQQCKDHTAEERKQKKETYEFMKKFRDTFSVPVKRLRFLGLFDSVNSVAAFEGAFLQRRTKFPYTAKSSAKVIRHAVSIDERRAKFRQDLISQKKPTEAQGQHHLRDYYDLVQNIWQGEDEQEKSDGQEKQEEPQSTDTPELAKPRRAPTWQMGRFEPRTKRGPTLNIPEVVVNDAASSTASVNLTVKHEIADEDMDGVDDNAIQDIQEVWFPGCHADIGGGWPLDQGEEVALSHVPLMWMIREAHKAGLPFDEDALREANFILEESIGEDQILKNHNFGNSSELGLGFHDAPEVQTPGPGTADGADNVALPVVNASGQVESESVTANGPTPAPKGEASTEKSARQRFMETHTKCATQGRIHDVLLRNNGARTSTVAGWNMMEWMPFRRMHLHADGSWKAIRLPLPRGEPRDIPTDAWIHASALRRMEADENYRPGNLIIGGGGRGMRNAPAEFGMGKWKILKEKGDHVGEVVVRAVKAGDIEKLKE